MTNTIQICALLLVLQTGSLFAQVEVELDSSSPVSGCIWQQSLSNLATGFLGSEKTDPGFLLPANEAFTPETAKLQYKNGSQGFHGLHILVEPTVARLNFNRALPYRNTWMGGGYGGLDFNANVGLRGFLFKSMNFGKVKIDEEKLTTYGLEFRLRIPLAQGLVPTAMFGSGYMNVNGNYKPRDIMTARSQFFGQAGLGLTMPLSDNFQMQAGARAVWMADTQSHLHTSCMYNLGIKLILNRKMKLLPFLKLPHWEFLN